jgi:hypothetical protein
MPFATIPRKNMSSASRKPGKMLKRDGMDRPFKPQRVVIGTLRPRSTIDHGKCLRMAAHAASVEKIGQSAVSYYEIFRISEADDLHFCVGFGVSDELISISAFNSSPSIFSFSSNILAPLSRTSLFSSKISIVLLY